MTENEQRVYDAYAKRDRYVPVDKEDKEFREHFDKWNYMDFHKTLKKDLSIPGQVLLYENLTSNHHVYYPKLSVYINTLPCDQTIEYEFFDFRRSWEWREQVKMTDIYGKDFDMYIGEEPSMIQRHIQWGNYIMVYGVWDSKPDWKELRRAYEETWWFHKTKQQKRDIKLNKIFDEYKK
jgi:hypothetical protein